VDFCFWLLLVFVKVRFCSIVSDSSIRNCFFNQRRRGLAVYQISEAKLAAEMSF